MRNAVWSAMAMLQPSSGALARSSASRVCSSVRASIHSVPRNSCISVSAHAGSRVLATSSHSGISILNRAATPCVRARMTPLLSQGQDASATWWRLEAVRGKKKKSGGTTSNNRDSIGRRLGLKRSGGQAVKKNHILIRQRGTEFHPGQNVSMGRDHTLHADVDGHLYFTRMLLTKDMPNRVKRRWRRWAHVRPIGQTDEERKEMDRFVMSMPTSHRKVYTDRLEQFEANWERRNTEENLAAGTIDVTKQNTYFAKTRIVEFLDGVTMPPAVPDEPLPENIEDIKPQEPVCRIITGVGGMHTNKMGPRLKPLIQDMLRDRNVRYVTHRGTINIFGMMPRDREEFLALKKRQKAEYQLKRLRQPQA